MIHQWQRNYRALIFQEKRYIKNKLLFLSLLILFENNNIGLQTDKTRTKM